MRLILPIVTAVFAITLSLAVCYAIPLQSALPVLICSILLAIVALLARPFPTVSLAHLQLSASAAMPTITLIQARTGVFPALQSATASLASTPLHALPASMATSSLLLLTLVLAAKPTAHCATTPPLAHSVLKVIILALLPLLASAVLPTVWFAPLRPYAPAVLYLSISTLLQSACPVRVLAIFALVSQPAVIARPATIKALAPAFLAQEIA